MPPSLLPQLAQAILSLHVLGRGWLATQESGVETDVLPVWCVHLPVGYCLWAENYVPLHESLGSERDGILLLGEDSQEQGSAECYLSWIGSLQAVGEQEPLYRQAFNAVHRRHVSWSAGEPHCLLQLVPQYGRISRSGEEDVALTGADLAMILPTPMAA